MVLQPTLNLTIPSIHDATALECRIYHPPALDPFSTSSSIKWSQNSAVFAHPYGPLGGSCDDHVVMRVTSILLHQGYVVATFNFRGSGKSQGRTSWSGRPEIDDYTSVVGFLTYYVHHLDPLQTISKRPTNKPHDECPVPVMILGGYSYGSLITMNLPPLFLIIRGFSTCVAGSTHQDIITRAKSLAMNQTALLATSFGARFSTTQPQGLRSPRRSVGMRIGGADSATRKWLEISRQSLSIETEEKFWKGLTDMKNRLSPKSRSMPPIEDFEGIVEDNHEFAVIQNLDESTPSSFTRESSDSIQQPRREFDMILPEAAYLLVSPLQGTISHLATLSLNPLKLFNQKSSEKYSRSAAEAKFWLQDTLAIFGDDDVFVSVDKLRAWSQKMSLKPGSKFRGYEVTDTGHFWNTEESFDVLTLKVQEFSEYLTTYTRIRR